MSSLVMIAASNLSLSDQPRKRAACDRCHSQKLRCLKRQDGSGCARCFKARTACIFSPSLRAARQNPGTERADADTSQTSCTNWNDLEMPSTGNGNVNGAYNYLLPPHQDDIYDPQLCGACECYSFVFSKLLWMLAN